jgi:hypothetical protein
MKGKKIGTIFVMTLLITMVLTTTTIASYNNEVTDILKPKVPYEPLNYNTPPNPPVIEGPHSGDTSKTLHFDVTITDPDVDDLLRFLEVDFGDETIEYHPRPERGFWQNGWVIHVSYKWNDVGPQVISARVQDGSGEWSDWSTPFDVNIQKACYICNFIERLIIRFPFLEALFPGF